ncbi:MAG TPA: rRNA maturation RNase YbeY, partial [Steroidobacteraceae bacterium]|nr:rRNA maturation RNase YbeY [Steroidobacteraceae bacterium]
ASPVNTAPSPRLRLTVQGAEAFEALPARSTLRRWIVRALQTDARLTLRFVGAREGRRLNRDYRGRDYATNVLTFDYARAPVEADIVLCLPVIAREARQQGKPLRAHLAHLVIHGSLHAQGHEHGSAAAAGRMERLEVRLLAQLGYPDPYRPARDDRSQPGRGRQRRSWKGTAMARSQRRLTCA